MRAGPPDRNGAPGTSARPPGPCAQPPGGARGPPGGPWGGMLRTASCTCCNMDLQNHKKHATSGKPRQISKNLENLTRIHRLPRLYSYVSVIHLLCFCPRANMAESISRSPQTGVPRVPRAPPNPFRARHRRASRKRRLISHSYFCRLRETGRAEGVQGLSNGAHDGRPASAAYVVLNTVGPPLGGARIYMHYVLYMV